MPITCPYCSCQNPTSDSRNFIVSFGSFRRKSDNSRQQRFFCKPCRKYFSLASFHPCFRQRKRHLNPEVFQHLASGVSQRRLAVLLKTNRKTIVRKFLFLGLLAYEGFLKDRERQAPCSGVEFDDLETFEHTKLKPLSVVMMVESGSRRILGFRVARMPAKGHLTQRSLKKYGYRIDERKTRREELLRDVSPFVAQGALIKSDESPHYRQPIRKHFPDSTHKTYKGRRACVTGQGELKKGGFDPLFSLNHSFAMLRANINRLFRKTWNTTKVPERLTLHIAIYAFYHNIMLI